MDEKIFIGRADSDIVPWFDCVVGDTRYITSPKPIADIANIGTPTLLPSPKMKDALTGLRNGARVIITHVPEYFQGAVPESIASHMYYTGQTPYRLITRSWNTGSPYLQPEIDIQVIPITITLEQQGSTFEIPLFHDMTLEGVGLIPSLLPSNLTLQLLSKQDEQLIDGRDGIVTVADSQYEKGAYFSLNAKTALDSVTADFTFTDPLPKNSRPTVTLVLYGKPRSIFTQEVQTTNFPWVSNSIRISSLADCWTYGWVIDPPVKQKLTKLDFEIKQYVEEAHAQITIELYKVTNEDWDNRVQLGVWNALQDSGGLNINDVDLADLVLDPSSKEIHVATFTDVTSEGDPNANLRLSFKYTREED